MSDNIDSVIYDRNVFSQDLCKVNTKSRIQKFDNIRYIVREITFSPYINYYYIIILYYINYYETSQSNGRISHDEIYSRIHIHSRIKRSNKTNKTRAPLRIFVFLYRNY